MNDSEMAGNWKELKGKVKAKWGELTDDDLDEVKGERQQLVGKLQQRYGKTREKIDEEVNSFFDGLSKRTQN